MLNIWQFLFFIQLFLSAVIAYIFYNLGSQYEKKYKKRRIKRQSQYLLPSKHYNKQRHLKYYSRGQKYGRKKISTRH